MHPPPPAADAMDFSQNSLFGYMEDLQELTIIERPVRRSLKTPEEIERLTVDEDLSDIERAVYLLSAGQDIQGTSVIANLPFLVRQNPAETLRRVLPKVRRKAEVDLTQTRRRPCEGGGDWSDVATSQGIPATTGSWKRQGMDSTLVPPEGAWPCQHFDSG
uniref:Protein phosphatase 4 regulatory subunit 4 n=1 Tax=Felis catus TaxID=9685 RepID=A0ABI7XWT4_FELCA